MSKPPEVLPPLDMEQCWPITWSHASEYNPFGIVRFQGGTVLEVWETYYTADYPVVGTIADISVLPDLDPRERLAMTVQNGWPGDNFFAEPLERLADIEPFVASDSAAHIAVTSLSERMRVLRDEALGAWLHESRMALVGLKHAAYVRLVPGTADLRATPGVLAQLHGIDVAEEDEAFYRGFKLQLADRNGTVGVVPDTWRRGMLYLPVEDE